MKTCLQNRLCPAAHPWRGRPAPAEPMPAVLGYPSLTTGRKPKLQLHCAPFQTVAQATRSQDPYRRKSFLPNKPRPNRAPPIRLSVAGSGIVESYWYWINNLAESLPAPESTPSWPARIWP